MRISNISEEVSVEQLRLIFSHDERFAQLFWRERPAINCKIPSWNSRFAGKPAGNPHGHGHTHIGFKVNGKKYRCFVHRILWALEHGEWPPRDLVVDHKNGVGSDNDRENRRLGTQTQNLQNKRVGSNNTSGFKGVSWVRRDSKWVAHIVVNKKRLYLGVYFDIEEAATAYDRAAEKYFGEFAKTNRSMGLFERAA